MRKTKRKFTRIENLKDQIKVYEKHAGKVAFDYFDKSGDVLKMTYSEYAKNIRAFASGLSELGKKGARIAIIGETSPFWHIAYHAIVCSGSVAIPLDKELALAEIENFLIRSEAEVIIFSNLFEEKFKEMAIAHPEILFIPINECENADNYGPSMISVIEMGDGKPDAFDYDGDITKMAVMLFTSGTTGTSKCVMLSEKNVCAAVNAACDSVFFFPNDVLLSVLPVHHTYELCCTIAGMNYGMEVAINDSLRHVLRNINKFKPTALVLVPLFVSTMEKRIWDELRKKKLDGTMRKLMNASDKMRKFGLDARRLLFAAVINSFGGRLKKIICGGAPLNQDVANTFRSLGIEIWEGYGITECAPLVAVDVYYNPKPGSVGLPVSCCEVKIEGSMEDKGESVIGEICVKGDNVMLGYYGDEEATKEAFTADGYFRTGDVGYMDKDGYLFITGREKSVIVLENGKNVFPEEIEEYLEPLDTIAECVVVGRKAENSDNVILTAVIFPDFTKFPEGTTKEEIHAEMKKKIAEINRKLVSYKHIREIEIRDTEFEKTTTRKIRRNLVK